MSDWRLWIMVLVAIAGITVHDYADGAWWGAIGSFAIGFAVAQAYHLGKRS